MRLAITIGRWFLLGQSFVNKNVNDMQTPLLNRSAVLQFGALNQRGQVRRQYATLSMETLIKCVKDSDQMIVQHGDSPLARMALNDQVDILLDKLGESNPYSEYFQMGVQAIDELQYELPDALGEKYTRLLAKANID